MTRVTRSKIIQSTPSGNPSEIRNKHEAASGKRKQTNNSSLKKVVKNTVKPLKPPKNSDSFPCTLCAEVFNVPSALQHHMNEHTGDKPYKCTREGCNEAFPNPRVRSFHVISCGKIGQFVCEICHTVLKDIRTYRGHMARQHETTRVDCPHCEKKFKTRETLKSHVEAYHSEATSFKEKTAEQLIEPSSSEKDVAKPPTKRLKVIKTDQVAEDQLNHRWFPCKKCGKSYVTIGLLARHETHCKPERSCEKCGKEFRCGTDLQYHMNWHNGIKPFVCRQVEGCPAKYSHPGRRNKHELRCGRRRNQKGVQISENARRVLSCELCKKSFTSSGHLTKHQLTCEKPEVKPKPPRAKRNWNIDRKFECDKCLQKYTHEGILRKHQRRCKQIYACTLCSETFKMECELGYHMNGHTGETPFECRKSPDCPERFPNPSMRSRHELSCGKPKQPRKAAESISCEKCGRKVFVQHLQKHQKVCGGTTPQTELRCDQCSATFTLLTKMAEHVCEVPAGEPLACRVSPGCSASFSDPSDRVNHELRCTEGSSFPCTKCCTPFESSESLEAHQETCDRTNLHCRLCAAVLKNLNSLRVHLYRHDSRKITQHECPKCDEKFSYRKTLVKHLAEHGIDPTSLRIQCEHCSKILSSQKSYQYHMNLHNGLYPYKCRKKGCDQSFYAPQTRGHHEKQCIKMKLSCDVCKLVVNCKLDLVKHKRTHIAQGFACELCPKRFTKRISLKIHMKQQHMDHNIEAEKDESGASEKRSPSEKPILELVAGTD